MARGACALALLCAVVAGAVAYTVDCNHEYTDCDTELSKLTGEDEDVASSLPSMVPDAEITTTTPSPTRSTPNAEESHVNKTEVQITTEVNEVTEEAAKPKPRLLNLNVDELQNFANVLHNQTKGIKKTIDDLSDVNLDEDEEESLRDYGINSRNKQIPEKFYSNLQKPFNPLLSSDKSEEIETCKEGGVTYKIGEHIDRGCEETCECTPTGVFECSPRCKHPFIRRGRRLNDPLCFESPVDDCCSIVACVNNNGEPKPPMELCRYGNDTYPVGESWHIGCEQTCSCERNSVVTCRPRCKPLPQSDVCINVQDPVDECCEMQICDVSHDAHEEQENATSTTSTTEVSKRAEGISIPERPLVLAEPIGSIKVLQNNTVQVNLMHANNSEDPIHLLLSSDGGNTFHDIELKYSNLILNLEGGKDYVLKTKETGTKFNFTVTATDVGNEVPDEEGFNGKIGCYHDGQFYNVGEEFHIGCKELCECTGPGARACAALQCPTHVGLELVSRGCVRWAPSPPAAPPACCPRAARCLSDGTCHYKGVAIPNWSEVPISLTGCEQHCFCENGELDCQAACAPLPALPPPQLRCAPPARPAPVNASHDDCCQVWGCAPHGHMPPGIPNIPPQTQPPFLPTVPTNDHYPEDTDYEQNNIHRPMNPLDPIPGLPPGLPIPNFGGHDDNKKLQVLSLQADSPTSIKMLFGLPPVLVGLRGSVDLRYTDTADEDVTQWYSQVFAPADEILTTPRLEFRLTGLKPSTTYKIRGKLYLHNLPVEPESEIYTLRTQDMPTVLPPEEKRKQIDSKLTVVEVNDTTAYLSWRHFTEDELQYIDSVQVRYRPVGTPIYSTTELLHHSRGGALLAELRAHSRYEAALVLAPPPRAARELYDPAAVHFTTLPYLDPYNFSVSISAAAVGATSARLSWAGAPAPAGRWVRVYRAAHSCRGAETDTFKLADRDGPTSITLTGLEPDSKCRVWLELFLTNGKVKTSNVLDIHTKSLDSEEPIDNMIEASSVRRGVGGGGGDYYGALVATGAVAALAALAAVLLLLVLLRRHRPRSVAITSVPSAPRESSLPPYDNPAYKLELQQETMNL